VPHSSKLKLRKNRRISRRIAGVGAFETICGIRISKRNSNTLSDPKNRSLEDIKQELKRLLVENLALEGKKPEDIRDDMDLFGDGGVGLDSLDGVEVVVILHRHFGLDTKQMQKSREIFRSVNTMAPYVLAHAVK
jgi:acyl carrier protein